MPALLIALSATPGHSLRHQSARTDTAAADSVTWPLIDSQNLSLLGVSATPVTYRDRQGLRIVASPGWTEGDFGRVALLNGTHFHNGTIEVQVAGVPGPDASPSDRGFVGIVFRSTPDASRFESFYIRPTNGRADDQLRRNHSVQYHSNPDFPWFRLREETPLRYEAYADLEAGGWTTMRVVVHGTRAELFINGASRPCLVVNDLKLGDQTGLVGLWIGPGTDAHFRQLTVADAPQLSGTLVAANMNDNTATVLDLATKRVLATLPTGRAPHEVAISHDGRWAVVSNYGVRDTAGHSLTVIDLAAPVPAVVRTIDLGEYHRPHGSAFLPGDTTLLVTTEANQVVIIVDPARGTVIGKIPTTQRVSHMLAVTPDGRRGFTTNVADGTLSELDLATHTFRRTIRVAPAVEGLAVSPSGDEVWVGSNKAKTVSIVKTDSGVVADTIGGFGLPYRMAVTRDGRTAIVTDPAAATVRFFDTKTRAELGRVTFPADSLVPTAEVPGSPCPEGIIITPDSRTAFVTLQGRNRVVALDVATRTVLATMPTGVWSDGIAYSAVTH